MSYIHQLVQILLHIDIFLAQMVHALGPWSYVVLFLIVFFEMGCILTPFLPGDSLLFAAGALAAVSELNVWLLMLVLTVACYSGMLINYWLGYKLGQRLYQRANSKWLNRKHLDRTHQFFENYGGKTVVISCFIAIIRTFTPFVAGMAKMAPVKYVLVSLLGSCIWVIGVLYVSYDFGNVPFVKEHFSLFVLAMIVVPTLVPVIGYWRQSAKD